MTTEQALAVASDPRVIAIVLARDALKGFSRDSSVLAEHLVGWLLRNGVTATEEEACALLDSFRNWDESRAGMDDGSSVPLRERFAQVEAALAAIVDAS